MFSVRLVKADHYMNTPIPGLDARYSEFRGFEVKQVPVIRIFGSTGSGQKVCLHIHGVFPYIYIPYDGCIEKEKFMYQMASAIDKAINISLGNSNSHNQHVYKITHVSAIPFYGYHSKTHQYLKIYFYNPHFIKKACDLLQNGVILGQVFQPHEAHIPYILQFCMDYNLHGMSFVKLACVHYRQGALENCFVKPTSLENIPEELLLPESILRMSTCSLEVDAVAADILNKQEISGQLTGNPGLQAIWNEEKGRRRNENRNSQFTPQSSQLRQPSSTASDRFHHNRLKTRLSEVALMNEISKPVMEKSPSEEKPKPYPAPMPEGQNSLEASFVLTHVHSLCHDKHPKVSTAECVQIECEDRKENTIAGEDSEPESSQSSLLNSQCLSLVQILQDLIEDDSVLGSQQQRGDEDENEGASDSEEVLSQTLEIENLECEGSTSKSLRTSDDGRKEEMDDSLEEERFYLPQLDGANDVAKEEEEDEDNIQPLELPEQSQEILVHQLNPISVCGSDSQYLTEMVLEDSSNCASLPSDLLLISVPENLCENKLYSEPYSPLDSNKRLDMSSTSPLELYENTDSFEASDPSNLCLINPHLNSEEKTDYFSDSGGEDCSIDTHKGVLPECLLLGDPWLTSQPTAYEKDECLNESCSSLKDSWPIDAESSAWVYTNEKYFSETSLITSPKVDEVPSLYEMEMSELSQEKSTGRSQTTTETKRKLSSLIKSRSKAKEIKVSDKIDSELFCVEDINSETINTCEFESSFQFGTFFQSSDYDQFHDEFCCASDQTVLHNIDNSLMTESGLGCGMKSLESCDMFESTGNKNYNFRGEMNSKLPQVPEVVTSDNDNSKASKPRKLPISSRAKLGKNRPISKKKLFDDKNNLRLEGQLHNGILNYFAPETKRRGKKAKSVKETGKNLSMQTPTDVLQKVENNYRLRNRVKYTDGNQRRSKQLNVQLKNKQNNCENSNDNVQNSMNLHNRTVKERLGDLVRKSIGKKETVVDCTIEEKGVSRFLSPNVGQCLDSSLSLPNSSLCEYSAIPNVFGMKREIKHCNKDGDVKKFVLHKRGDQNNVGNNIDVSTVHTTKFSLQFDKYEASTMVPNVKERLKTYESSKEDKELAKKRIGQYVRHKLGLLVESRSKLSKFADKEMLLSSEVPNRTNKSKGGCRKVPRRYSKNKRKVVKSKLADVVLSREVKFSNTNTCDIDSSEKEYIFLDDNKESAIVTYEENLSEEITVEEDLVIESLFKNNRDEIHVYNQVPETSYSQSLADLMSLYSIRPCCVKLQKLDSEKLRIAKLLKSERRMTNYCEIPRSLLLINQQNFSNCSQENSKVACDELMNSEGIVCGNQLLKTNKVDETNSCYHRKCLILTNKIIDSVNPVYEHNNRIKCEELNMKCIVPNSPKSVEKGMKSTGRIGSLKAVVQAESPRVADTLDSLPENPAQTIHHYALGGSIYSDASENRTIHFVGDYLQKGNVVEVAKVPTGNAQSADEMGPVKLSVKTSSQEEKLESTPTNTTAATSGYYNENMNCEGFQDGEVSKMNFLTFVRVSPRKRCLQSFNESRSFTKGQPALNAEEKVSEKERVFSETLGIKHVKENQTSADNLVNERTHSLSGLTSKTHIREKTNRVTLSSRNSSANKSLSLNQNDKNKCERQSRVLRSEDNVSINVRLKSMLLNEAAGQNSLNNRVINGGTISQEVDKCVDEHCPLPANIVYKLQTSVSEVASQSILNLDCSRKMKGKGRKPAMCKNIKKSKEPTSIPFVDGANDSSTSDTSNDSGTLVASSRLSRKRVFKHSLRSDGYEEDSVGSYSFDDNISPREKLEVLDAGKDYPVKTPKIQTYKPFDVRKKSSLKTRIKGKQLRRDITSADSEHNIHKDLMKYLSSILRKRITKQDVRKFNPHVMVMKLYSCISNSQTVNINSRLRPRKLNDVFCICADHNKQNRKNIAGVKCDKREGVSLDLQLSKQFKMTSGFKHHGGELAKTIYV